jgi:purine-binding chemotaxis protein CheW
MDIAEIRKKAKKSASGGGKGATSSAPAVPVAAGTDGMTTAASQPVAGSLPVAPEGVPVSSLAMANAQSALDRLFATSDGVQFASEEVYQTALAARGVQEESDLCQFLAFQLGTEEYALDINQISEIIKPREYTDIPRVPDYILGLISLRGVVVPIYDLRQRFQMGKVEVSSAARVIVCREGDITVGLLVDKINQVVKIAVAGVEPPPSVIGGIDRHLISGIGRYQGRMIILLNLTSVLETVSA